MDISEKKKCKLCDGEYTIKDILNNAKRYWPELDILICSTPCCKSSEDLQIKDGLIERGYVYAAGSVHFAAMESYIATGLKVVKSAKSITYSLNGIEKTVSENL